MSEQNWTIRIDLTCTEAECEDLMEDLLDDLSDAGYGVAISCTRENAEPS
jgi:hypothetical protein